MYKNLISPEFPFIFASKIWKIIKILGKKKRKTAAHITVERVPYGEMQNNVIIWRQTCRINAWKHMHVWNLIKKYTMCVWWYVNEPSDVGSYVLSLNGLAINRPHILQSDLVRDAMHSFVLYSYLRLVRVCVFPHLNYKLIVSSRWIITIIIMK